VHEDCFYGIIDVAVSPLVLVEREYGDFVAPTYSRIEKPYREPNCTDYAQPATWSRVSLCTTAPSETRPVCLATGVAVRMHPN